MQETKSRDFANHLVTFTLIKCEQKLNIEQNRKKSAEIFGAYLKSAYLCSVLLK